jgi:hypothetical protein
VRVTLLKALPTERLRAGGRADQRCAHATLLP